MNRMCHMGIRGGEPKAIELLNLFGQDGKKGTQRSIPVCREEKGGGGEVQAYVFPDLFFQRRGERERHVLKLEKETLLRTIFLQSLLPWGRRGGGDRW